MSENTLLLLTVVLCFLNTASAGWEWADSKAIGGWRRFVAWLSAICACAGFAWVYFVVEYWLYDKFVTNIDLAVIDSARYVWWVPLLGFVQSLGLHINFSSLRNGNWGEVNDIIKGVLDSHRRYRYGRVTPGWAHWGSSGYSGPLYAEAPIDAGATWSSGSRGSSRSSRSRGSSKGGSGDSGKAAGGLISLLLFILRWVIALLLGVLTTWILIRAFAKLRACTIPLGEPQ